MDVYLIEHLQCGFTEVLDARHDKVEETIKGGEPRDGIALVESDGSLDVLVRVRLRHLVGGERVLGVQFVEHAPDLGLACEFFFLFVGVLSTSRTLIW